MEANFKKESPHMIIYELMINIGIKDTHVTIHIC